MELIFEFILELVLEGSIEASKSSKIPKYVRYPLIVFLCLFFIVIIGLVFLTGILSLKENVLLGIFFLLIGLLLFIISIIKFRETYLTKVKNRL